MQELVFAKTLAIGFFGLTIFHAFAIAPSCAQGDGSAPGESDKSEELTRQWQQQRGIKAPSSLNSVSTEKTLPTSKTELSTEERKKRSEESKKRIDEMMERHRREADERAKESLERAKEKLEKAKIEYAKTEKNKSADPGGHMHSAIVLGRAYQTLKQPELAKHYQDEAFKLFSTGTQNISNNDVEYIFRNWRFGRGSSSPDADAPAAFRKLLMAAIRVEPDKNNSWHSSALDALDRVGGQQKQIELIEHWMAINPGRNDPSNRLQRDLNNRLASLYERSGNIEKSAYIRKIASTRLPPKSRDSVYDQFQYAQFCARNKRADESERVWRALAEQVNWQFPRSSANSFSSLLETYDRENMTVEKKRLMDALLAHPTVEILEMLDNRLRNEVNGFVASTRTLDAEILLRKRVDAGKLVPTSDQNSYWILTLSDICIANGKRAESDKLFNDVVKSMALRGLDTSAVLQNRQQLLKRLGEPNTGVSSSEEQKTKPSEKNKNLPAGTSEALKKETKIVIPKAITVKPITFNYVLFARERIALDGNIRIGSVDTSKPRIPVRRSERGDIFCPGELTLNGNVTVNGTVYGALKSNRRVEKVVPLTTSLVSLPPAPLNSNATEYKDSTRSPRDDKGGDFKSASLELKDFGLGKYDKLTRIFLYDNFNAGPTVATLHRANYRGNPRNLQIWYNGTRRIVLPHNCNVSAIIYAPNAEVYMPSNNHNFTGAIVANTIVGEGNIEINYDDSLRDQPITP